MRAGKLAASTVLSVSACALTLASPGLLSASEVDGAAKERPADAAAPETAAAATEAAESPRSESGVAGDSGAQRRTMRGRTPAGRPPAVISSPEIQVQREVRDAVLAGELYRRLSVVSRSQRFSGTAPAAGRWQKDALGQAASLPVEIAFSRSTLQTVALRDGSRVWLASGHMEEPAAVLRLGDLLPLLSAIGINDREAALSVTSISFGGGTHPPVYTMTFQTGALWRHRKTLAAGEQTGRLLYSLASGRVTVLGALVVSDAEGELLVKLISPEGEDVARFRDLVMPVLCAPLETGLRSENPRAAQAQAILLLEQPSVLQGCASRYFALAAPDGAAVRLRGLMTTGAVATVGELVSALVHLEPNLSEENLAAIESLIARTGVSGVESICQQAPLHWSDTLLHRGVISEVNQRVLKRCLRR